jgi:fucose 4-O-acetylase-like acetyltransferase
MTKRLLLLNGLAALMVVINHAASYGLHALFFWTDRYRDVTVPNFDQYGSAAYYVLFIAHEVAEFAIPAFLFVSGYFVAFAARTAKTSVGWDFVFSRIKKLIIPFVIWITILIILLQKFPPTLQEVLTLYYYIPLIIQYYLLSPILVPLAKNHWKLLLIATAIIQLGLGFLRLPALLGLDWPGVELLIRLTPIWFFPGRIFYFSIGLVAGMHVQEFGQWISRVKWGLLITAIIVFAITIIEYEYLVNLLDRYWLIPVYAGALKPIYAVSLVLCILAFAEVRLPYANKISDIGAKSLGIYFINTPVLYVVGSLLYYFAPAVLGMPFLYQAFLLTFGYMVPLLMMSITVRTPARKVYHYVFG